MNRVMDETSKHRVARLERRRAKECRQLDLFKFSLRSLTHLHLLHCKSSMTGKGKEEETNGEGKTMLC